MTAPTGLLANPDAANPTTQLDLTWTPAGAPVSGYNVYRGATPGGVTAQLNNTLITTNTYSDSLCNPATTYYYVVRAVNGSLLSAPSSAVGGVTQANPPLSLTATFDLGYADQPELEGPERHGDRLLRLPQHHVGR